MGKKKWPKLDQREDDPQAIEIEEAQKGRLLYITHQAAEDMGIADLGVRLNVKFHGGFFGGWEQSGDDDVWSVEATAATTTVNFQYQTAQIIWYLPSTYDQPDAWLYELAIHELAHVLASPVSAELINHPMNEFYTEWVARAMLSMKKAGENARS